MLFSFALRARVAITTQRICHITWLCYHAYLGLRDKQWNLSFIKLGPWRSRGWYSCKVRSITVHITESLKPNPVYVANVCTKNHLSWKLNGISWSWSLVSQAGPFPFHSADRFQLISELRFGTERVWLARLVAGGRLQSELDWCSRLDWKNVSLPDQSNSPVQWF